jgi:hypothetical protein
VLVPRGKFRVAALSLDLLEHDQCEQQFKVASQFVSSEEVKFVLQDLLVEDVITLEAVSVLVSVLRGLQLLVVLIQLSIVKYTCSLMIE